MYKTLHLTRHYDIFFVYLKIIVKKWHLWFIDFFNREHGTPAIDTAYTAGLISDCSLV